MANKKPNATDGILKAMSEAQYRLVKSTEGRMYFCRPTKNNTGTIVTEYQVEEVLSHVVRLLVQRRVKADKTLIQLALTCLKSETHDADPVPVYNRVAKGADGTIYLDLNDRDKRVIEVRADEWRECKKCPVLFNRPPTMLPLPMPTRGHSVNCLRTLLSIDNDDVWWLCLGFLIGCLQEPVGHFVGVVQGPSGSGKSTLCKYLGRVLDPRNPQQVSRVPSNPHDLMVAGANRYVLAFDNLTPLSGRESAVLCSISTGGGTEVRQLWTNSGSCAFDLRRPILLNGIQELMTRSEVQTRAIPILLSERSAESRRGDDEIEDEFLRLWPGLLGALLDLAVKGLNCHGNVCSPSERVRMDAAATWIERCLQGANLGCGLFLNALRRAQSVARQDAAEEWSLLPLVRTFAEADCELSAAELFELVSNTRPSRNAPRDWPNSVAELGRMLRSRSEELREVEIQFTHRRTREGAQYHLTLVNPPGTAHDQPPRLDP